MSKTVTLKAYAKINLSLDIVGTLNNGYHMLESIFQSVSLCDMINVSLNNSGFINVTTDRDDIPSGENNIASRAAKKFFNYVKCNEIGADIKIWKGIPLQAGLGGGSTDAAAVLKALNILTNAELTDEQLCSIGAKIGADVPFCIIGGTAYVEGTGEKITSFPPIANFCNRYICIAKGLEGISTADAYQRYDLCSNIIHPDTKLIIGNIKKRNIGEVFSNLINVFEQATELEDIDNIKKIMLENDAAASVMTGSGSAVFGIFNDIKSAEKCSQLLRDKNFFADICSFKNCGSELI